MDRNRARWPAAGARMVLVLAFLAAAGLVARAEAQSGSGERGRVQAHLERTDEMLAAARDVVHQSGDPRASEAFALALRSQENAWDSFRGARYGMAFQQSSLARDNLRRAVGFARQTGDLERRGQRALEEAERAMEQARACAGDPPSAQMQALLTLAAQRLGQAREAFQAQKFRVGADIAVQVRRMLEEACGGLPASRADRRLEAVQELLDRAAAQIEDAGDPNALQLYARAQEQLQRAQERRRAGQYEPAVQLARQAADLCLRALRASEAPPDAAGVDRMLESAAQDIDALADEVRASGDPDAVTLLDRAYQHLQRARELRAQDQLRAALAEARVARNLAWRAAQLDASPEP